MNACYPPDTEFDPHRVLIFWAQGLDTTEIGRLLGMDEDEVHDILVRHREAEYEARQTHRQVA